MNFRKYLRRLEQFLECGRATRWYKKPRGPTLRVEPLEDRAVPSTFEVNNPDDVTKMNQMNLRQAIEAANLNPGLDTITFNLAGSDLHPLRPLSALPAITDPVLIDGTLQPGYSAGAPVIVLDGSALPAGGGTPLTIGVDIAPTGAGSTVQGLVIDRFDYGIRLQSGGGNTIRGNVIGASEPGSGGNAIGVLIDGSPNNTIGGTTFTSDGLTISARNVISGNRNEGVQITGSGASGNRVLGNLIGTTADGTGRLPNLIGIAIRSGAARNTIGLPGQANVISGNAVFGVEIDSASENTIRGNLIGTTADGTGRLGNGLSVGLSGAGVLVTGASSKNRIGGAPAAGQGNVISANEGDGVRVSASTLFGNPVGTEIRGNFIGTQVDGEGALGNTRNGVLVDVLKDTSPNRITANRMAFNGHRGVRVESGNRWQMRGNWMWGNGLSVPGSPGDLGISLNTAKAANNLLAAPTLGTATLGPLTITITGSVTANPAGLTLEFFWSRGEDAPGVAQGERFLFAVDLPAGTTSFSLTQPVPFPIGPGEVITATVTDRDDNTSGFSNSVVAT